MLACRDVGKRRIGIIKTFSAPTRYAAPTLMTPLRDLTIIEGEKVHFDAKVGPVGDPSMRVEWFCNGKAIAASKFRFIFSNYPIVKINLANRLLQKTNKARLRFLICSTRRDR